MTNTIIAKVNGRDKVLDFRDGLVPANVSDYAMLHGIGGKDHASNSVIKLYICDYSAGTGDKSKTVSANVRPELCEQIFEVCKHNIGTAVFPDNFAFFEEQRVANSKSKLAADMNYGILDSVVKILARFVEVHAEGNELKPATVAEGLLKLLTKTKERAEKGAAAVARAPGMMIHQHMDYSYTQDRVHAFGAATDIAPVQRLQIWHTTYRKQGDFGNYPWTVKVINGKAKVKVQANGATSFDASSMFDTEEAFIQVSDADMFRAMSRICHFVNVWEMLEGAKVVQQGLAAKEAERNEYRENKAAEEAAVNATVA